jgi:hypothetical protein
MFQTIEETNSPYCSMASKDLWSEGRLFGNPVADHSRHNVMISHLRKKPPPSLQQLFLPTELQKLCLKMQFINILVPFLATTISPVWSQTQQPILNPQETITQPLIGFGTWNLKDSDDPENTTAAVAFAIQTGYRQIDCAAIYGNEKAIGKGIAEGLAKANLSRSDIWVTSKLWNDQ